MNDLFGKNNHHRKAPTTTQTEDINLEGFDLFFKGEDTIDTQNAEAGKTVSATGKREELNPDDFLSNFFNDDKHLIRRLSNSGSIGLWGYILFAAVISLVFKFFPSLYDLCTDNTAFYISFDLICAVLYILVPFLLVYAFQRKLDHHRPIPFSLPRQPVRSLLLVFVCFGVVILGSFASSYFVELLETVFDIKFIFAGFDIPESKSGFALYIIRMAVFPALAEELVMRGIIMQPLRHYGDTFAICMSSMMFALLHGNMIQVPFAFIAGFALGYAVIKTESLWTGILIHLLNNALSVFQTIWLEKYPDDERTISVSFYIVFGAAAISLVLLLAYHGVGHRLRSNHSKLTTGKAAVNYIFTLPMICAILYMIAQTVLMSDKGQELLASLRL